MDVTRSEVLQFAAENDVKFVRLAFCDLLGRQKNIAVMADLLPRAFESGIPFDASGVLGFAPPDGDVLLFPDPATLTVLPWRPSSGRVARLFCTIKNPDKTESPRDGRALLRRAEAALEKKGYVCRIGTECEFYLLKRDEEGTPVLIPQDQAGYCDIAPLDKGENVRRQACLTLEEMGIPPKSSHHEKGPGQNEIVFHRADALGAADHFITFQSIVKTAAAQNGVFASFMPRPLPEECGSGMRINLTLMRNKENLFIPRGETLSGPAAGFVAGVMRRIPEITAFLNPLTNSYSRLAALGFRAAWTRTGRTQLVRIPLNKGQESRMEISSPDATLNPYLAFALLLYAGLEGIEEKLTLPPAAETADAGALCLPKDLGDAVAAARESEFLKRVLPPEILEPYLDKKEAEFAKVCAAKDKTRAEHALYFLKV